MSKEMLKNLIYDMSMMIQAHNLENVDSSAASILRRADSAMNTGSGTELLTSDRAQMIESIRQENIHPYSI